MSKYIIAFVALATFSWAASAAPSIAGTARVEQSGTSSQEASPPAESAVTAKTSAAAKKQSPADEKLKIATEKPKSLKAAVNQAVKAFVPTEQIDVDKAVDFPTNI